VRGRALALAALAASACRRAAAPPAEASRQTFAGLVLSQSVGGAPAWTLRAARAFLHEDEHRADLEAPVMDFYRDGKHASTVSARAGVVDTQTHDVRLSSSVVLDSDEDRSHLTTEQLLYTSKTGMMTTDLPVVIRRPDGVVRGRGLRAKPDLSEIRIFNQNSTLTGKPK
jgi:LPS export ABC transporter protein LptC